MYNLSPQEKLILNNISKQFEILPGDLYSLINFESKWNPTAANPYSTAKGLIQFIDSTANDLGYINSQDLINKNPTILDQLQKPVYDYLKKFAPYNYSKQKLYMSVFYPKYMNVDINTQFPDSVKSVNPGIQTVQDYIQLVDRNRGSEIILTGSTIFLLLALFFILKKRQK